MAVKLRLKRMGKRHRPFYRLNAMDSRSPRDGRVIEELGFYDPLAAEAEQAVNLKKERIEYWLSVGAQPSDTARSLMRRVGIEIELPKRPTKPSRAEQKAAEAAAKGEGEGAPEPGSDSAEKPAEG